MVTRREALGQGTKSLQEAGRDNPRLDAEVLLLYLLGESRAELYRDLDEAIPASLVSAYKKLITRRKTGVPLQYLTGSREFMGLDFIVSPTVLIPRPETEILVEVVIDLVKEEKIAMPNIVDLGTGSGAIAVSLAKHIPEALVYAVDLSPAALAVARENARLHNVLNQVIFYCGDLFAPLEHAGLDKKVDVIVSNPPYIPTGDLANLPAEVKDYEPLQALNGGADGLAFYRLIAVEAVRFLRPGGWVVLEVGQGQAPAVKRILQGTGVMETIWISPDLAGIERVVVGRMQK